MPTSRRNSKHTPSRKRQGTEQRLIAAVGAVLEASGVKGIGVNRIAAEAGVDKALIYRYFGGLTGLLTAYGETAAFWPDLDELLGPSKGDLHTLGNGKLAARILSNYAEALRRRPVTRALLAWECVERTPLTAALEAVRERRSDELFAALETIGIPLAPHLKTAAVLFSAALQYLVIRADSLEIYGGLDIGDDAGWKAIKTHIECIFETMLSTKSPAPDNPL